MSLRFLTTPIGTGIPVPSPRASGPLPQRIREAFVVGPGGEALLDRLDDPDALVVTTGQQPGLFTGPLYTLYKALSAAVVAARLEASWERPVIPVFWLASDDHDYAEARGTAWLDASGAPVRAELPDRPSDAPLLPMYRLPLGPAVSELVHRFAGSVAGLPFAEAASDWLGRHWTPERTLGSACGTALAELLAPRGVLCLDSTHPAVKRALSPHLVKTLAAGRELDQALALRASELRAQGKPAPVTVGDGAGLVFLEDAGGRDRLLLDGEGYVTRRTGERFSLDRLATIARQEPTRLSPNVLLRPVMESALLPTVAYVAGPGELAYLPLATPIYQALDIPVQLPVPRWSGVMIEPRVERVLARFDADLEELMQDDALERRVVRSDLPGSLLEAVDQLRDALGSGYDRIREAAAGVDPTMERPIDKLRRDALDGLEHGLARIERAFRRRRATELEQVGRARAAIAPDGRPQERVYGPAGFLARYGPAFVEGAREAIDEWYATSLVAATASP